MNKYSVSSVSSVATFLFLAMPVLCSAQDEQESEEPKKPKVEMLSFAVKIIDPDGHPLEGAMVSPSGLRSKTIGGHWGWREEVYGSSPRLTTNDEGLVKLPFPKYLRDRLETGAVTVTVSHLDFVAFRGDRNIEETPAVIQLKRGFRIAATAIDAESGSAIKKDLYGMITAPDPRFMDWKMTGDVLVSPVFPHNKSWLRVIKITPGESHLFSDLIEIDPAGKSRILLRDIKLSKGTRVVGKLADTVTRPVKNGYVAAEINRKLNEDRREFEFLASRWHWREKTPIAEDGTFVFESLPRDEILQMIACCDAWTHQNPEKKEVFPFFPEEDNDADSWITYPQITKLNAPTVEVTIRMAKATSLRIKIVDQNGSPLKGVLVGAGPSQHWYDGGSQILGTAYSMPEILVVSQAKEFKFRTSDRFTALTDEHGFATIRNFPANRTQQVYAQLEGYEVPINGTGRSTPVTLKPDSMTELTIKMQPAGRQSLGD